MRNQMSKTSLIGTCEVAINTALKRLSKINGNDKKAIQSEFREWLNAVETNNKNYEVLYIDKID